jgi:hypothetical protein
MKIPVKGFDEDLGDEPAAKVITLMLLVLLNASNMNNVSRPNRYKVLRNCSF